MERDAVGANRMDAGPGARRITARSTRPSERAASRPRSGVRWTRVGYGRETNGREGSR
jgi:hypothetical protein